MLNFNLFLVNSGYCFCVCSNCFLLLKKESNYGLSRNSVTSNRFFRGIQMIWNPAGFEMCSSYKYLVNTWKWSTLNICHLNPLLLNWNFRVLAYVYASIFFVNLNGWQYFPNIIIIPILWFSVTYMIAEYFLFLLINTSENITEFCIK